MTTPWTTGQLPAWIDTQELDELEAKFPSVPRVQLALLLQSHWPVRDDVEAAIRRFIASCTQQGETSGIEA